MECKELSRVLDEGGYVDYRDVFRQIEYEDSIRYSTEFNTDFQDIDTESLFYLNVLANRNRQNIYA